MTDRLDWRRPRYEAIVWWCGDEECDCCQPQIILRTPNPKVERCDRLTLVWEGTFMSSSVDTVDYEALERELEEECERRGIPVGLSYAD